MKHQKKTGNALSVERRVFSATKAMLYAGGAMMALAAGAGAMAAQAAELSSEVRQFNIAAASLPEALNEFASSTKLNILFSTTLVEGKSAAPLNGRYSSKEALNMLLEGTGLAYDIDEDNTVYIRRDHSENMAGSANGNAADADAKEAAFVLEEIVVTATKRSTSLQDTALSLSVLTGDKLEKRGITSINDFITTVPGVSLASSEPGEPKIIMRGIATNNLGQGNSTASVYVDEFTISSISSAGTPDVRLVDVARVEVLKGPQGTVYGQAAMGGVVRYITNKPSTEGFEGGVSGYGSFTDGGGFNQGLQGYVNVPVTDNLALRFVGYHYDNSGFIDVDLLHAFGPDSAENVDTENTRGGRVALKWDITENIGFEATYLYQQVDVGSERKITPSYTSTPYTFPVVTAPGFVDIDVNNPSLTKRYGNEPYGRGYNVLNLKLDASFDLFDVSIMGARKEVTTFRGEVINEYVDISHGVPSPTDQRSNTDVDTLEVRLVSNTGDDSMFNWLAGFWYEDSDRYYDTYTTYYGPDISLFGFIPLTNGQVIENFRVSRWGKEYSGYGELGINFTEKASLTLGYRRSHVETEIGDIIFGGGSLGGIDTTATENINTYKANLEYRATDDVLFYLLASSGYRLGGFNPPAVLTGTPASTYGTDSLWNYELGARTTWLDGRLTFNAVAYYVDWSDIQLPTLDPLTFVVTNQNAGKAEVKGLDIESNYYITDNFSVGANLSYTDATLKEDYPTASAFAGDRLPGSSKFSYALFADFTHPVNDDWELSVRGTHRYIGGRPNAFAGEAQKLYLPSYSLTDVRVGLSHIDGMNVSLFADNIFNNMGVAAYQKMGHYFGQYRLTNRPRTIGINLGYDF